MKQLFTLIILSCLIVACKEGAEIEEVSDEGGDNIISQKILKINSLLPSGTLPYATQTVTLQVQTSKPAICKYAESSISYYGMQDSLSTSDGINHTHALNVNGVQYHTYYVSCQDQSGAITFGSNKIEFNIDTNPVDTIAPVINNVGPTATQSEGTTSVLIYANTNEAATCRYSNDIEHEWNDMSEMSTTGENIHNQTVGGLSDGNTYNYYFICEDPSGNRSDKKGLAVSVGTFVLQDGLTLYNNYCAYCHGNIPYSEKQGATASAISGAINGVGVMNALDTLKPEEVQNIANALQ